MPPESASALESERGAEAAPDASTRPPELFTKLSRTGLFLDAIQRECLGQHGLGFAEFSVLRLLQTAPRRRLSPTRLAEAIVRTTGAVTKLVDRLERAGYVERLPDEADRRGVLVRITPSGSRAANRASRSYSDGRERILSRLSRREIEAAMTSLERLLEALEVDREER